MSRKPKLAVWKFASCDGCQLSLLDCEDELLGITEEIEIAYFLEASSASVRGPYDLSLVEGSITTEEDAERIQRVRRASKKLVTIGACATAGGIQALRNFADVGEFLSTVYASPEYVSTLATSTPISAHVQVDFELNGCPISKHQLLEVIGAFLQGRRPNVPAYSVCMECKRRGNVCVMVAHGTPCLGPVTHAGCGAICPSYDRGCYGCFGPMETPNTVSLTRQLRLLGMDDRGLERVFHRSTSARRRSGRPRPEREADEDDQDGLPRARRGGGRDAREDRRRLGRRDPAEDLRAAALLRGLPPRPRLHGGAGHHRAHLRICPVAYQMSAVRAMEDACGVEVDGQLRALRRLLYCGEWIESHALHVFMLHLPDFLGYESAIALAKDRRDVVERALELKRIGNEVMTVVGGREIHPVNVRVGGFYRAPRKTELRPLVEKLERAREIAVEAVALTGSLEMPEYRRDYELVCLDEPTSTRSTEAGSSRRRPGH